MAQGKVTRYHRISNQMKSFPVDYFSFNFLRKFGKFGGNYGTFVCLLILLNFTQKMAAIADRGSKNQDSDEKFTSGLHSLRGGESNHKIPANEKIPHRLFFTNSNFRNPIKHGHTAHQRIQRHKRDKPTYEQKEKITIWPHSCRSITRKYIGRKLPIIFECAPSPLHFQPEWDSNPETSRMPEVEEYPVGNETGSQNQTQAPQKPNRPVRDMYAVTDVVIQFSVPGDVTELRLWYQGVVSIESGAFQKVARSLRVLNLQHNQISYLSVDAFQDLSRLTELDLSYNRLQSIPSLAFKHFPKLEVLKLNHNEISFVQNSLFCGLGALVTLDLSHNVIEDIGPHALHHFESPYTVSIEVGHNKLTRPRKEWLQRGPATLKGKLCVKDAKRTRVVVLNQPPDRNSNRQPNKSSEDALHGSDYDGTADNGNRTAYSQGPGNLAQRSTRTRPIRIMQAKYNPWSCSCDASFDLVQFLRMYNMITASQYSGFIPNDVSSVFRYSEMNLTADSNPDYKNKTAYENYFKWYFTMPCKVPKKMVGIDIGRLTSAQNLMIEKTCCHHLLNLQVGKKILEEDAVLKDTCNNDNSSKENTGDLSDNQVTVIGIVIVFSTPILLTLCPDCDKAIHPSGNGGMMSAGKFGISMANSSYNNNNPYPHSHDIFRTCEIRPKAGAWGFGRTKSGRSLHAEEAV